ncbi:ABC transporter permease [Halanaerobium salsuginis]|uniref:Peptide/nickel transport system permease protein n=1 Tax=Halanaerobium salsuginis TaxID=29563 RepID=A0A1I4M4D8_9FIRM|nr:ABC transporter permease [Halanaerobium salsuginis]SFL98074.1 peptide/nickel transport system permease protein [Halanaerobium salsuginis]
MISYIIRRSLLSIPMLIVVSLIAFFILTLPPGDYMTSYQNQLTSQAGLTTSEAEKMADQMREKYGLDKPFLVQYYNWIKNIVVHGDFGYSFFYSKTVAKVIWGRLGYTLLIAGLCHFISVFVGILIGIFSATHQYSAADYFFTILAFLGVSIPAFFLAIFMMYLFSFKLGLGVGGLFSDQYIMAPWSMARVLDLIKHLWLPVTIVGFAGTARNMRVMRSNLLDVLGLQYIQTAKAKGLKNRTVIYKHAVKNAIKPIVMSMGSALPFLITGEMITSIVLDLPTTGPAFYNALVNQDMYLAGSFLMMIAVILIIGNLLADIALAWVDPRVRYN